jgi:Skp family chaperone for outer membrane proteins
MYRTGIIVASLFTSLMLLGCGSNSSSNADSKISNAGDKIGDAEKASIEAAKAKRDEYAKDMQKALDELDAKYKALEKRASEANGDSKKELDDKVKVAKAKRDVAAKKLDELKEASHDRWEKIKDGVGSAFDDLKKVVE